MSKGIRTSINHNKRVLYLRCRNSNSLTLKGYYKLYCKVLSKVIKQANTLQYRKKIQFPIINQELFGTLLNQKWVKKVKEDIPLQNNNGTLTQNPQTIANTFNDYFLTIAEDLLEANQTNNMNQITNTSPLSDLLKSHNNP